MLESEPQLDQVKDKARLEQEQSEKAIVVYVHTLRERGHEELSERDEELLKDRARVNASALSSGGARLGMPGYMNCKLQFVSDYDEQDKERKFFRISPNGADNSEEGKKKFLEWEEFVRQRFEENGLPFRPY